MRKINLKIVLLGLSFLFTSNNSIASQLSPTIYYIKTIDTDQDCKVKKTILSVEGKSLFTVCKNAYTLCLIEGTCAILKEDDSVAKAPAADGLELKETAAATMTMSLSTETLPTGTETSATPSEEIKVDAAVTEPEYEVINYVRQNNKGTALFMSVDESTCPWGYGVNQICLDPYYSVAADLNFHRAGEVIFVNKLKGLKLPNGDTHSGFMIVRDRGGAIKGANRFDFYTGILDYRDEKNPFTPAGFATSSNKFEYRKANADETAAFRKIRNFPKIPVTLKKSE